MRTILSGKRPKIFFFVRNVPMNTGVFILFIIVFVYRPRDVNRKTVISITPVHHHRETKESHCILRPQRRIP